MNVRKAKQKSRYFKRPRQITLTYVEHRPPPIHQFMQDWCKAIEGSVKPQIYPINVGGVDVTVDNHVDVDVIFDYPAYEQNQQTGGTKCVKQSGDSS